LHSHVGGEDPPQGNLRLVDPHVHAINVKADAVVVLGELGEHDDELGLVVCV
jgi:hypothetical protein